ncbi:MAG: MoaD/ThiS family protein [Candidatus Omnitrophica bacterium]|nr:MoaD/ThiS family protein [Candidatus Omnitrophota bacterium]
MTRIKVLFFAELGEIFGRARFIDIKEGSTVGEVVDLLAAESDRLYPKEPALIYAVNANLETREKKLKDRDELALMTPMSGG